MLLPREGGEMQGAIQDGSKALVLSSWRDGVAVVAVHLGEMRGVEGLSQSSVLAALNLRCLGDVGGSWLCAAVVLRDGSRWGVWRSPEHAVALQSRRALAWLRTCSSSG